MMEFDLGSDIYLSSRTYNDSRVVDVRKYERNGDKKFPTKKGICMWPIRFAALVMNLGEIDEAYEYVSKTEGEYRTVHISGCLYASVSHSYRCVNLRYYFKSMTGNVLPSKYGIALPIPVWKKLMVHAPELRDQDPDLKSVEACNTGNLFHHSQMGFFECGECNPFINLIDPLEIVLLPPAYTPLLKFMQDPPVTPAMPPLPPSTPKKKRKLKL